MVDCLCDSSIMSQVNEHLAQARHDEPLLPAIAAQPEPDLPVPLVETRRNTSDSIAAARARYQARKLERGKPSAV